MPTAEDSVRGLPLWQGLRSVTVLKGGISNAAFAVEDATGRYVARVGKDYPFHQVSRAREAEAHRAAEAAGLSPALVYHADGIMVVRHLDAKTFTEADVQQRWQDCLALVQRCHRDMAKRIRGQGAIFWVFQILRDYAETLRRANHRAIPQLAEWMLITDQLEQAQVPLPIIFGHHDLLAANFMDDGARHWLIDWEYGAFGTPLFDLGNLAAANSFPPPIEAEMLRSYFGAPPDGALTRAYHAMKTAAALREAMWAMVSELYLASPGVDYVAYAAEFTQRFTRSYDSYRKDFS
jgi:thiamine kinase-like enzyme